MVCMPSRGRAEQMVDRVFGLLDTDLPRGTELVVVVAVPVDDGETLAAYEAELAQNDRVFLVLRPVGSTAVDGWNRAFAAMTEADWYVLGADDIEWDRQWLKEALLVADDTKAQVIGLNDGHTDLSQYAPHYMAHWSFTQGALLGGKLVPPGYVSWWFDREVCEVAQALGVYAPAHRAMARHKHPDWGDAPMDETYQAGQPFRDADRALYWQRTGRV